MGHWTKIHGYIEGFHKYTDFNREALQRFEYDEQWPFTNVFFGPIIGYGTWLVPFATRIKADEEEWPLWIERFEALLLTMQAQTAVVQLEAEMSTGVQEITYSLDPVTDTWRRRRKRVRTELIEETTLDGPPLREPRRD